MDFFCYQLVSSKISNEIWKIIKLSSNYAICWALAFRAKQKPMLLAFRARGKSGGSREKTD